MRGDHGWLSLFVLVVYHPTKSPFEKGFLKDCALNSEPTG